VVQTIIKAGFRTSIDAKATLQKLQNVASLKGNNDLPTLADVNDKNAAPIPLPTVYAPRTPGNAEYSPYFTANTVVVEVSMAHVIW
jgi:hypothetical protein